MATGKKFKLAVITTHVIQYAVPLYKKISAHPDIDLTIFFCSQKGSVPMTDSGFNEKFKWDMINLEGLNHKFLKNYSPFDSVDNFFGLFNPGIIPEIKNNRYDAVFIGGYSIASFWLAFLACWLTRTPYILSGEPPSPLRSNARVMVTKWIKRLFMPALLEKSAAIIYIGEKSKEYYLSLNKRIGGKLFFCPYSVDNDYFLRQSEDLHSKKEQLKKELGIPADYPVILYLSKLTKWKRPMFLLKVFEKLDHPANLVYVGSGYRLPVLKEYISIHNLKRIFFFGFQNYSQVSKFYSIADIFVLPSMGESWGLVINEAMCFGLPVVVTNKVMSAYDLVKHGENGYIFSRDDLDSFVGALNNLLKNSGLRNSMGAKSLEIIRRWNYQGYIKGLLGALEYITKK